MNFVYISPNFPDNHWNFCRRLKENGLNVLGDGDCPYEQLTAELKASLNEYYKVSSLENYDEVYRAVAFFIHKYGRIDYLESNNEYWLERDAELRQDFHITSGFQPEEMPPVKFKSRMKESYAKADIPVARWCLTDDQEGCAALVREVGYPVIVKPDNGVGATSTFKLHDEEEFAQFFAEKDDTVYIMEEFIDGTIVSYDAIVNSQGEPLFETGNVTIGSLMDIVNEQGNCMLYIRDRLPEDLRTMGRAALAAFGVKKRFVHFEFFRLNTDQRIGKAGELAALEVNMRPSGGISPTMMNYANSTDVYQIWADMIAFDTTQKETGDRQICAFAGRRDHRNYVMSREDVLREYASQMREEDRVDPVLATDMGDYMFMACFPTLDEVHEFYRRVLEER